MIGERGEKRKNFGREKKKRGKVNLKKFFFG